MHSPDPTKNEGRNTDRTPRNGNLKAPWKDGQSGNPAGRPKGSKDGIDAHCRRLLTKDLSFSQIKDKLKAKGIDLGIGTNAEAISVVLVLKALTGDLKAIEMLGKFELDLPDLADDPSQPPMINITFVQAESAGYEQPVRKSITINGKQYPVQLLKRNQTGTADFRIGEEGKKVIRGNSNLNSGTTNWGRSIL